MDFGVISAAYKITLKLKDLFTKRGKTTGIIIKHEAQEQGCLRMEKTDAPITNDKLEKLKRNFSRCANGDEALLRSLVLQLSQYESMGEGKEIR